MELVSNVFVRVGVELARRRAGPAFSSDSSMSWRVLTKPARTASDQTPAGPLDKLDFLAL